MVQRSKNLKITGLRKNIHQALFQDLRIKIEIEIKMIYALTLHYWSSKVQACIFLILSKLIVDTFESSLYIRGIGNDKEIYKCTISIRLFKVGLVVVVFWFSFNYSCGPLLTNSYQISHFERVKDILKILPASY